MRLAIILFPHRLTNPSDLSYISEDLVIGYLGL